MLGQDKNASFTGTYVEILPFSIQSATRAVAGFYVRSTQKCKFYGNLRGDSPVFYTAALAGF